MAQIPRPSYEADSTSGDFEFTMSELLFLFGRHPSDVRWLESADKRESLALVSYFGKSARHNHGAAA